MHWTFEMMKNSVSMSVIYFFNLFLAQVKGKISQQKVQNFAAETETQWRDEWHEDIMSKNESLSSFYPPFANKILTL